MLPRTKRAPPCPGSVAACCKLHKGVAKKPLNRVAASMPNAIRYAKATWKEYEDGTLKVEHWPDKPELIWRGP